MTENIKKYTEIIDLFNRLRGEMNRAVQSYYIWRTLYLSRSINEVGEERAKITVEVFNLYKDFFIQTEDSHLNFFIITISKFFDPDNKSLSLHFLVNKIRDDKNIFIPDTLIKVYPERYKNEDLKEDLEKTYTPIKDEDIYEIKKDIRNIRKKLPVLNNLEGIRNKKAAHNEIEVTKFSFIPNEVEDLINAIQDIMNKISSRIEESETNWDHLKDGAMRDTNYIIKSLYKGEQLRLKEIQEKYMANKG